MTYIANTAQRLPEFGKGFAPVHVELFGAAGMSAHGYALALNPAGIRVASVELNPKIHAHNPYAWFTGDWRKGIDLALTTLNVVSIGASPPCTKNTAGTRGQDRSKYDEEPDIEAVREVLAATGLPYVIENVESEVTHRIMRNPVRLCGFEFGLTAVDTDGVLLHLKRHRLFEANFPIQRCGSCPRPDLKSGHPKSGPQIAGAYGGARRDKWEARYVRGGGYVPPDLSVLQALTGAPPWLTDEDLIFLGIPPVYTQHIGGQLLTQIERVGLTNA